MADIAKQTASSSTRHRAVTSGSHTPAESCQTILLLSDLIDSYAFFRPSGHIQFTNFSFQIFLPSIMVSIGVRPQHILP